MVASLVLAVVLISLHVFIGSYICVIHIVYVISYIMCILRLNGMPMDLVHTFFRHKDQD